jgi:S-formylglutathione hydrolase FrmB
MLDYIVEHVSSTYLADNCVGDSATRNLVVHLPPGYQRSQQRYPAIYHLHGFGGCALNSVVDFSTSAGPRWRSFRDMAAESITAGRSAAMIHVFPDGANRWGCSQWVGNEVQGDYDRYVAEEVVRFVDERYRTIPSVASRGLVGASSGGIGTFNVGARHPEVFGALAVQCADIYMEVSHVAWLVKFVNACHPQGPRGPLPGNTWTWFTYGLALAYSPNRHNPPYYVDLPILYPTGELVPEVWQRWLAYDPIRAVYTFADNLCRYKGIYLDVGFRDEHDLHLGHRILNKRLDELGITHENHEHDGTHSSHTIERLELIHQWFSRVLVSE